MNASFSEEGDPLSKSLLWLYVPNYDLGGRMSNIDYIPARGSNSSANAVWT